MHSGGYTFFILPIFNYHIVINMLNSVINSAKVVFAQVLPLLVALEVFVALRVFLILLARRVSLHRVLVQESQIVVRDNVPVRARAYKKKEKKHLKYLV